MKRLLAGAGLAVCSIVGLTTHVTAGDTDHILTVDGVQYNSYKETGGTVMWNTPDTNPTAASYGDQIWDGKHGADNLPCEFGIHWVSNDNLLTISNCLDGETTTTVADTTTTVADTTTTVADTTTTVGDTTTTAALTVTTVKHTDPTTTVKQATTTQAPLLVNTGSDTRPVLALAAILVAAGCGLTLVRRSRHS